MIEIVVMPKLGFNMDEGRLVKWYKAEGDTITKGEPLFAVETDKTSIDIEAIQNGIVRKLFADEGEVLSVTLPIAIIADAEEEIEKTIADIFLQLGKDKIAVPDDTQSEKALTPAQAVSSQQGSDTDKFDHDIFIIGGGPGGYVAAIKAAQSGKKVALAEKDALGGTCLNKGCIPTKALLRSAEAFNEIKNAEKFGVTGVDTSKMELDFRKIQSRKTDVVGQLVSGVEILLKKNGVDVYRGEAILEDNNTVSIDGQIHTSEYIIIATGSSIKSLPIEIDKKMNLITSDEALSLEECPKDIVIVGGGVVGIEIAFFLSNAGSKVTVIEFLPNILPMVDEEISGMVKSDLENSGIQIYTNAAVNKITAKKVVFEKDGEPREVEATTVLMAVGRVPNLEGINCEKLGIETNRNAIVTDKYMKTSIPNIYAIGDVNGKVMLAHTASAEGLVAIDNICGHINIMNYNNIPSVIYIEPQIASTGLTEKQAKEKYSQIKVGKFPMVGNGKSKVAGDERGLIKVITETKYGEIVGIHSYCLGASDMIVEGVLAIDLETTAEEMLNVIHPHPTVSEAYHEAFHAVQGKAIHI